MQESDAIRRGRRWPPAKQGGPFLPPGHFRFVIDVELFLPADICFHSCTPIDWPGMLQFGPSDEPDGKAHSSSGRERASPFLLGH